VPAERLFIQAKRSRPEPIPWGSSPPDAAEVCAYDRGVGRRSYSNLTASEHPHLVFPPPPPAREHARQLKPYLASIDTTLKELDTELTQARLITPYIERVTRMLERLEQWEAHETCAVPAAPIPVPPVVYMPPPVAPHTVQVLPEK